MAAARFPARAPEIARELYVSVNTVRTHMWHLYDKLGAHRRLEAIGHALRQTPPPCTLMGEEVSRRSQCTHVGPVRVICFWDSCWGGLATWEQKLS